MTHSTRLSLLLPKELAYPHTPYSGKLLNSFLHYY